MNTRIIVGYDGSPASHAAMTWALDEAARVEAPIELVYADDYPSWQPAASMVPSPGGRPQSWTGEVITPMLDRAAAEARRSHPLATVTTAVVRAHPAAALVEHSAGAAMVVLGAPGLLGWVGAAVACHTRCPVVVVRGAIQADPAMAGATIQADPAMAGANVEAGPVVAGGENAAVIAFAAAHAAACKVPLHIIQAGDRRPSAGLVTLLRDTYPGLEIEAFSVPGHPADVLTRASEGAQTLVVGVRGRGRLGSVSRHLLRHADCPVAVVPDILTRM